MRAAKIGDDNLVVDVIIGDSEWAISNLGGFWVNVDSKIGVGWTWSEGEGFKPPQPYPSWTWIGGVWVAPIAYPDDGQDYQWDEESQSWVVGSEPEN